MSGHFIRAMEAELKAKALSTSRMLWTNTTNRAELESWMQELGLEVTDEMREWWDKMDAGLKLE